MNENRDANLTSICSAQTLEEIGDFWDSHSLADHWDETQEAEFEVRVKRRRRVTLEPEVYNEVEEQARARGIAPEPLVNVWLLERLRETG